MRWALACMAILVASGAAPADQVVDGIAAQVGSEIVLISEVRQLSQPIEEEMRAQGAPETEILKIRATVLDRLIERRLIQIVVQRAELQASDVEIDNTLASIAQENGLTPEQLRQSVEAQGLPYQAYRVRIRGEIEQAKVVNGMVAASVRVEDEEVRALYHKRFEDQPTEGEEVHLRQIVVGVREDSDAARSAACDRAETALARIEAGAAFAEVAYEVSDLNANTGGDVGWVHVDSLAAWMRSALDALEPGQMSGVLRTPFACTFLELVERRSYEPVRYEQVESRLRDELFDMRMQEEFIDFLDKIREQTYVERKGIYAGAPRQGTATLPATSGESPGP